jgi:glycosyltransferase involved in cell wall biosynthesis
MKVLQTISYFTSGGLEKLVLILTNELSKREIDVTFCIRESKKEISISNNVELHKFSGNNLFGLLVLYKICKLIKKKEIDIVHAHIPGGGDFTIIGFLAAKITGKKFVLTIHGDIFEISKKKLLLFKFITNLSDKVVTVSDHIKFRLLENNYIKPVNLMTIENGIDISPFDKNVCRKKKLNSLDLDHESPIIGSVGMIRNIKGYDVLITSFSDIIKLYPNAKLLIIGTMENKADLIYKTKLDGLISRLNLQENIIFLGFRNNVNEILAILDVFVLPSRSEGISLSLLEAMASRKPIVATFAGGTKYVLENNLNGILVPPEDTEALANGILKLLIDKIFATELGIKARETIEKKFSLNGMLDKYVKLYDEILAN